MQSGTYIALSGQLALQRRLETIANNIANASTPGFRAEQVTFETVLSHAPLEPVAFSSVGKTYISRNPGEITRTENPLDVAVDGDAWLAIQTPAGQAYTRDGRMRLTEAGELQTLAGHPVLDVGGAPLLLDPDAGPPEISRDGTITQNNRQVGALGLFRISADSNLTRYGNAGVIPDRPAEPILDFVQVGVMQGYVERANVTPVHEMSRLITISRSFEAITGVLNEAESSLREAIRNISGNP
jgi:flagellar basal-body rod protein FlgF